MANKFRLPCGLIEFPSALPRFYSFTIFATDQSMPVDHVISWLLNLNRDNNTTISMFCRYDHVLVGQGSFLLFLFPASRSEEGELLYYTSSVRPSVRPPQMYYTPGVAHFAKIAIIPSRRGTLELRVHWFFLPFPGYLLDLQVCLPFNFIARIILMLVSDVVSGN